MANTRLAIIGELNKAGATDVASSSNTNLTIEPAPAYPDYANGKLEFAPRRTGGADRNQGIRIARPFTESSGYYVIRGGANFTNFSGQATIFSFAGFTILSNASRPKNRKSFHGCRLPLSHRQRLLLGTCHQRSHRRRNLLL